MDAFLGVISILGFFICLIMAIVSAIKKSGKVKKWAIGTGVCFLLFVAAVAMPGGDTPTTTNPAKSPEQIAQEKADAKAKAKQEGEAKAAKEKADAEAKAAAEAKALESLKAEAKTISYKDLARSPDTYKGAKVKYTGEVAQVQESGNNVALRVNVTKTPYGYDDTVFIIYDKNIVSGRILEDDIITFWGESAGLITYQTVLNSELTIPQINVKILELNK